MRLIPGQSGPDRRTSPGHGAGELVAVAVQQLRRGPQRRVVRNGTPARSAQAGVPIILRSQRAPLGLDRWLMIAVVGRWAWQGASGTEARRRPLQWLQRGIEIVRQKPAA